MDSDAGSTPAWWQVHARLMPDYNRAATAYWWLVVLLGGSLVAWSLFAVAAQPVHVWLQIALCTLMAMAAGMVPVRVPGSTSSFTAGEIFIFLLLLSSGVEAAALASACEALVGSWRTSRRWTSRIASPAIATLALSGSGVVLQVLRDVMHASSSDALLLCGAIVFAFVYFVANTLLMTTLPRLKRGEALRWREFVRSYGWLGLNYVTNATVATFLYLSYRQSGIVAIVAAAPIIVILLTTGHFYFRRKEAGEAMRAAQAAEAERTALHVQALEASERRFHSAFTHASIGMALVSFNGAVRQVNDALRSLLGLHDDGPLRLDFTQFVSRDGNATLAQMLSALESGRHDSLEAELRCRHSDGREVWVSVNGSFFSEQGSLEPCLILQVQDISARQRAEAKLHHFAFHDSLTGLPNRHLFNDHLVKALVHARADPAHHFGVMFLDFDRFKLINDSMGHPVGDEFLVQVSRRIERSVRSGDIVARLGGDEFAILTTDRGEPDAIVAQAIALQVALGRPFHIGGTDVATSSSIGITYSALGYSEPEDLLRDADIAMYKAKSMGRARHALFDVSLHEQVTQRLRLEGDLRRAVAEGAMSIEYQPLFDLNTQALIGFEALARWEHPQLGRISPGDFIPVAEESGSMVQLTDFMLDRACRQLRVWQLSHPLFTDLKVHVNVAGNDVAANNLVPRVSRALIASRLRPQDLSIELTENILMESLEAAIGTLNELHDIGIGLSVDDFGTGYSSLSHLSTLPIDSLKIDRSFVKDLRPGSKEAAVIRAVVLLGKSLGKEVIAEGIETLSQQDLLRELGCDIGQGYFMSRPLTADAIDRLLVRLVEDQRPSVLAALESVTV